MNGYIGIDPGATGAIAVIREDGDVSIYDYPGDERQLIMLMAGIALDILPLRVVIEYQQSMPKQGVASTFKLGVNYGSWLTAVAAYSMPLHIVRPKDWKSGMGYPVKKDVDTKKHSLTTARRLYPQAAKYLTRAGDHNRAEALLLAHYAKLDALKERERYERIEEGGA